MQDQHTSPAAETVEAPVQRPLSLPEFAALDPDCALAPGLFRSLPKGEAARKHRLEVVCTSGAVGSTVTFKSPDLLGADDMRVLQGVMALVTRDAAGDGALHLAEPQDAEGAQLVLGFEAKDDLKNHIALRINGSWRAVARAVGLDPGSGPVLKKIQKSVERLCGLSVVMDSPVFRGAIHFMAAVWTKNGGGGGAGDLKLALNPRLAGIALSGLGEMGEKYIRIDLGEVRALRTDAGRLIHQRLCGWIDPGTSGKVRLDTLCGYVWPEDAPTRQAMAKRRQRVRRALRELQRFGRPWVVSEYGPGRFEIGRPARLAPVPAG